MPVEQLRSWWEEARTSLWFLPSILTIFAGILGFLLPEIDNQGIEEIAEQSSWLFSGSPSAARAILSAIAGSLITVISLLFSITIVALQQASTQFTPRVFRHFTSDRGNQIVLGTYIATFTYAILILRQVRDEDAPGGSFVPILSVIVALFFVLVCLALLIYYIHHASTLLQASTIIERSHRDLIQKLDQLYPEEVGEPASLDGEDEPGSREPVPMKGTVVTAGERTGYLQAIDDGMISNTLPGGSWAIIYARTGEYITRDQPILEYGDTPDGLDDGQIQRLRRSFIVSDERTLEQDALFGFRQLVDVALKALSPSINDPTTAEQAISSLGDALTQLVQREIPSQYRVVLVERNEDGETKHVRLWFSRPDFEDYVEAAFNQIRLAAQNQVHVLIYLLRVLGDIGREASEERAAPLREQVETILWQAGQLELSPLDRGRINEQASQSARLIGAGSVH